MRRGPLFALVIGWVSYCLLPWYAQESGFFDFPGWAPYWPMDADVAPAALSGFAHQRPWLLALAIPLLAPVVALRRPRGDRVGAAVLIGAGLTGLLYLGAQGFAIGPLGVAETLQPLLGVPAVRQYGMGAGALGLFLSFITLFAEGVASRGLFRGDGFVAGSLYLVLACVVVFVLFPIGAVAIRAIELEDGSWSLSQSVSQVLGNIFSLRVFGLGLGEGRAGVATRSVLLALLAAFFSTALGLLLAALATRTSFRGRRVLGALTILPVVTPPFVIGLAMILIFGRAGVATAWLSESLGIEPSRWVFGLPGILLAQVLAFTPVAFMVLVGVIEGISPSLEEAALTLGADSWHTLRSVTLPLLRPGLANAFLLGFIESLADFGNPLVLGGGYDVLSTEIYFAIAGADSEVARAAALSIVLLALTLVAFLAQEKWLGGKSYVTVTGKADSGAPLPLPKGVARACVFFGVTWTAFTAAIYLVVLGGGFVKLLGRDNSLTSEHFVDMFRVGGEPFFSGGAWDSLATTIWISIVSAPITAAIGLLTAWLIARHRFRGRGAFELFTMMSFAVPGTVVGVGYVMAFNTPPVELTGTAAIIVVCFVFRNMAVGVRSGLAALAQIDPSLDEASICLGASTPRTLWSVTLPLLRPAVIASLVYGFVRAMTAVSAVVFLVSGDIELSTTYILGRVEAGHYGPAIAYSSAIVFFMLLVIALIEGVVGKRELGRRGLVEGV
ncbi:MAG: iron ABC transporter permease [Deltaproteobacteria bacterium]|nr:iron ABC transporter permease [Deltaproteobacteria bacterium]